ncbi:MAG: hypothetical protein AVDCRST_MAG43-625 [uncultured Thermomicrobiales bacterium]|uniref:Uncharacterized protein n=1 Tax=uncultured Thermomicrobiales bacterium TaxID=1645740 RepID=A0A6J4UEL5_9BACT|nr:MAG: hypothetical protein AVDCRST_MAG43-625 [uncultured Thermomicrobiales bacterium]
MLRRFLPSLLSPSHHWSWIMIRIVALTAPHRQRIDGSPIQAMYSYARFAVSTPGRQRVRP